MTDDGNSTSAPKDLEAVASAAPDKTQRGPSFRISWGLLSFLVILTAVNAFLAGANSGWFHRDSATRMISKNAFSVVAISEGSIKMRYLGPKQLVDVRGRLYFTCPYVPNWSDSVEVDLVEWSSNATVVVAKWDYQKVLEKLVAIKPEARVGNDAQLKSEAIHWKFEASALRDDRPCQIRSEGSNYDLSAAAAKTRFERLSPRKDDRK